MAEIEFLIDKMVNYELREASNYVTRSTIKMRVAMRLISMLGLSLHSIYETKNLIRIDISCSRAIEKLWKSHYNNVGGRGKNLSNVSSTTTTTTTSINNSFPTSDECATLERFLAKDFARNVDLIRLTAVLRKRLPEKDLNFIFAVDGLHSRESITTTTITPTNNDSEINYYNNDYRNYFENLSVPIRFDTNEEDGEEEETIEWIHVKAIRTIYKRIGDTCVTPEKIGNVLRRIFNINCSKSSTTTTTQSNNILSTHSNHITENSIEKEEDENSSSDSDENDNENGISLIEKNIESVYKNIVGHKLLDIASWKKMEIEKVLTKEKNRKRRNGGGVGGSGVIGGENGSNDDEHRNKPGRPRTKKVKLEEKKRRAHWLEDEDEQ